VYLRKGVEGE